VVEQNYVLLVHVRAFDAEMPLRSLQPYRGKGFEFVSLAEAESDKFYRAAIDLNLASFRHPRERNECASIAPPLHTDFAAKPGSVCR
jgi:hypothetical protein